MDLVDTDLAQKKGLIDSFSKCQQNYANADLEVTSMVTQMSFS
jgi:hypothetical protein